MMNFKKMLTVFILMLLICIVPASTGSAASTPKGATFYSFNKRYSTAQKNARKKIVSLAKTYLGTKEMSAKHKKIVNTYNSIRKNLYHNGKYMHFTATTQMPWCDIFVSAIFKLANLQAAVGTECGCEEHIILLKKMGCWVENDAYVPSSGDLIFYDWDDNGRGDNRGWASHVGIVVSVSKDKVITTIEGNYDDTVKYRTLKVNGRYIRGYGVPKY